MTNHPAGWEDLLDEDETILWQGQPGKGIIWSDLIRIESVIGAFFTLFSTAWITGTLLMLCGIGAAGPVAIVILLFPLVGSIFFVIGLYLLVGRLWHDAYERRNTWYTLTNKAAFIATNTFGRRRLQRVGVEQMRGFDLVDQDPGTIWFGYRALRSQSGLSRGGAPVTGRLGFRLIPNPRAVWALMEPHRREAEG